VKVSLILTGVALFLTPLPRAAVACATCRCVAQRPAPSPARVRADAVFSGRVVGLVDQPVPLVDTTSLDSTRSAYLGWALERFRITIEVERVWKGEIGTRVEAFTGSRSGVCGFAFEAGKEYLVYARRTPTGDWYTSICTRTRLTAEAELDFAALGQGVAPTDPSESARPPHN
jgi:hypothetical protein